jgi:cell division septation protein DedD
VNLGKYIHELLLENETVIIPGFGAFVSVYKPAEIRGEVIKPPSKEISFTQQIRNNDGMLVGYLSNQEGVSHFEALKTIEKQRENLTFLLDKGERVILDRTGTLYYNADNELEFEPFFDDNLLLDSYGLESISSANLLSQEPASINERENIVETVAGGFVQNEPAVEGAAEKPAISVIEKTWSPDMADEPEKRKKRSVLWYSLILIAIVIAGVFLLMNERKPVNLEKQNKQEKMVEVKKPPVAKPDVLLNDALENKIDRAEVLSDSLKTSIPQTENEVGTGSSKFHLVGGGFKEEANAKDFVVALKNEGFDAFLLGKRGNFYLVAIGTYQSEGEAVRARRAIAGKDTAKNLWILEE